MARRHLFLSVILQIGFAGFVAGNPWVSPLFFPLGTLVGLVRVKDAPPPKDLSVEVRVRSEAHAQFACSVTDSRFTCPVLAGDVDVRLDAPGFAPVYFWNLDIQRGETVAVDSVLLHPGSSVSGWIEVPAGSTPLDRVTVELEPETVGWQGNPAERKKAEIRRYSASVGPTGFFQLTGLSPGAYTLTAQAKGLSPARTQLTVPEVREIALAEPLRLEPLTPLQVWLTPAANLDGTPWQIELFTLAPGTNVYESLEKSAAASDGNWSSKPLQAGTYEIVVRDTAGSRLHQAVHRVDATALPLFIDLDLVPFRGTLTLGDEPLQASVVFGTTNREPNVRVEADEEGRFEGYLPKAGTWPVEVILAGDRKQRVTDVEVRRLSSGEPDFVEVALPDTRIAGRVIAQGKAVRDAFVVMIAREEDGRPRREAAVRVDRDGRFEARGLSPGNVSLRAYDQSRTSEWMDVEIGEGAEASGLTLELGERTGVKGTLAAPYGPVAGGLVVAWQILNSQPVWLGEVVSAADGNFELSVDARAEALKLVAVVPGCGVEIGRFQVPREPGKLLMLICTPAKGEILLKGRTGPGSIVFHRGADIEINALLGILDRAGLVGWSEEGTVLRLMPEGPYRVCSTGNCQDGELTLGGTLTVSPPVSKPGDALR